jgi:hypothetical protein
LHVDERWIPAVLPPPAGDDEEARLLRVFRNRIFDGTKPTVSVREMLLAGVRPAGLRKVLDDAAVPSDRTGMGKELSTIIGGFLGALTGLWIVGRDKRDLDTLDQAHLDLDRWEARLRDR